MTNFKKLRTDPEYGKRHEEMIRRDREYWLNQAFRRPETRDALDLIATSHVLGFTRTGPVQAFPIPRHNEHPLIPLIDEAARELVTGPWVTELTKHRNNCRIGWEE